MYQIVRRHQFSESTFLWDVYAPDVARAAQPGHFVMLRLREGGERIPLTVADYDREWGTVTIVIQAIGKTTREMMAAYQEGDTFLDFVGPLGRPRAPHTSRHVARPLSAARCGESAWTASISARSPARCAASSTTQATPAPRSW